MTGMAPPEFAQGHPGGLAPSWSPVTGPGWAAASYEDNPDLVFPWSVFVYDRMRRTDTQVAAILRAVSLPLRAVTWSLNTEGVDPAVAAFVADELNLNGGQHRRGGVSWRAHLREVLLALPWGFAPFETVYAVGPSRTPGAPPQVAHLAALALRPPRTITEVKVSREGDLLGIVQCEPGTDVSRASSYMVSPSTSGGQVHSIGAGDVFIKADRLAYYCLDREGADWTGTSLLRAAYKDWMLKEQNVRAAGQAVERNSMGLPVVEYDDDGDRHLALEIASAARAGSTAGIALPRGRMSFSMEGVTGSTVDALPLIDYHDRSMTRSALAMFLDLGHDNGARSLGETFVDFFTASLRSIAEWAAETATDQVIRPLVALNFGDDAAVPTLTSESITARQAATADALKALVDAGIIKPDDLLETETRRTYGLPEADPETAREAPSEPPAPMGLPVGMPMSPEPLAPGPGLALPSAIAQASALADRLAALAAERR